ncbi:MAG: bacillithiol biosynthesis cysteine-adding enzyme BshC, partial [Bacteroidota bacterium]
FNECKASIFSSLSKTEFSEHIQKIFSSSYCDGVSFNVAFASLINSLLGDSGVVFLYANDRRLKRLLIPLIKKEITEHPKSSQIVIERSAELDEKYHAQIKPRPVNLFLFYNENRYAIDSIEEKFWLRGTRKYFAQEELLSMLEQTPEKFSPNVVLRPLCQDVLLPTVAYIAGPSEIAYFAQLKPLYEYFQIPMPIIYPRASITIIEQRVHNVMEKFNVQTEDFFRGKDEILQNVSKQLAEINIDEIFQHAEKEISFQLEQVRTALQPIDSTLVAAMENAHSKIVFQLNTMKERANASTQKKYQTGLSQIEKAFHSFLPNDNWQERELNSMYFLNKYGMNFLEKIQNELAPFIFHHQLIEL